MLSVVLITPVYAECGTAPGLYTQALARHYTDAGHRVEIICAHAWAARATYESHGRLRIHRVSCRRQNLRNSFACSSIQRVQELHQSLSCDVIIEIDASPFDLVRFTSTASKRSCWKSKSITIDQIDRASDEQLPIFSGTWQPPQLDSPSLLAVPSSHAERVRMVDTYFASRASGMGWALMVLEQDGNWTRIGRQMPKPTSADAILMAYGPGARYFRVLASEYGISHTNEVASNLGIDQAISTPEQLRREQAFRDWQHTQRESCSTARSAYFDSLLKSEPVDSLTQWRTLEESALLSHAGDRS